MLPTVGRSTLGERFDDFRALNVRAMSQDSVLRSLLTGTGNIRMTQAFARIQHRRPVNVRGIEKRESYTHNSLNDFSRG